MMRGGTEEGCVRVVIDAMAREVALVDDAVAAGRQAGWSGSVRSWAATVDETVAASSTTTGVCLRRRRAAEALIDSPGPLLSATPPGRPHDTLPPRAGLAAMSAR